MTVKSAVSAFLHSPEYRDRWITPFSPEMAVTHLYRHVLAREPRPVDAAYWAGVAQSAGWTSVINSLQNSAEYTSRFGDHIVPGYTAHDCVRAKYIRTNHGERFRNATDGGANVSFSTPAYVSLDEPRSLTFTYSSGLADPRTLVEFVVVDPSTTNPPEYIELEVRNDRQARMTFTNGLQVVRFRAGAGESIIAAEFREPEHPNRAVGYTAVVRKFMRDGTVEEHAFPTRAANLTASTSEFGHGWELDGFQRLYEQGDGVHITESGSGTWFAQLATDAQGILYESPAGDFTTLRRSTDGTYSRVYPGGGRVLFHPDGRMWKSLDRHENATTYSYDGSGRLRTVEDPAGLKTTFEYTAAGALAWVQDPMERRVTTTSTDRVLWRWRLPDQSLGLDLHFVQGGERGAVLDTYWTPRGSRSEGVGTGYTVGYDLHGRVASVTDPAVQVTESGIGQDVEMRTAALVRSRFAAILAPAGTGTPESPSPRVAPNDVRIRSFDARSHETVTIVDPVFGSPWMVQPPLGNPATTWRDRHGREMTTVSPTGHMVVNHFRGVELRKVIDVTTGRTTEYEYEPMYHQVTRIWGTDIEAVVNTYDQNDPARKLVSTHRGPATTLYTYYPDGRALSVTDPENHGTTYSYGPLPLQNLREVASGTVGQPNARSTITFHDRFGRDSLVQQPGGEVTETHYDLLNRPTKTIDASGGATTLTYLNGVLYNIQDPKGQFYHFHPDRLNRVASTVDARDQWTFFRYDRAGNQTGTTNRRGQSTSAAYDALGRVISREADGATTTWSYDANGLGMEVANAESRNRMEVDKAGRPTRLLTTLGGVTYTQVITSDSAGRRTQLRLQMPNAGDRVIEYGYGSRGQLNRLVDIAGGVTTFPEYNHDGQEEGRTLPTGLVIGHEYPSIHVAASVSYSDAAVQEQLGRGYHFNANGVIDAARMPHYHNWFVGQERVRHYVFDPRGWLRTSIDALYSSEQTGTCPNPGQLIDEDGGMCVPSSGESEQEVGRSSYTYDAVGNRTDVGAVLEPGNRLMVFDGGKYSFEYDADGNMLRKVWPGHDDLRLAWNSLGQLTAAWRYQRANVSYGYDGLGRRVRRTLDDGTVTRYLWDGDDLLMELDGAGNPVREYTYYPGVDNPHSVRSWPHGGAAFYYASDRPGNVVGLLNSQNQIVNQYHYTPWGQPEHVTEAVAQPLRYMSREYDDVTGLYQVRARWYDPHTGRFVSEDPKGLEGGMNLYGYAANNPVNLRDPSGLDPRSVEQCIVDMLNRGLREQAAVNMCNTEPIQLPGVSGGGGGGGAWVFPIPRNWGMSERMSRSVYGLFFPEVANPRFTAQQMSKCRRLTAVAVIQPTLDMVSLTSGAAAVRAGGFTLNTLTGTFGPTALTGVSGHLENGIFGLETFPVTATIVKANNAAQACDGIVEPIDAWTPRW